MSNPKAWLFAITMILTPAMNKAQDLILREPVTFLALGDSYTIGEQVQVAERWPEQLFDSLAANGFETEKLTTIARTGWTTEVLIDAILAQNPPKEFNLVSLLIGVNDQYQGLDIEWYKTSFKEVLSMAVDLAGGNKDAVFVLSIPDYAYTPFGQGSNSISKAIDAYNEINKSITQSYEIPYIDITPISREGLAEPSLVASDGLHPSGLMYSRWVSLILEKLIQNNITSIPGGQSHSFEINIIPNPADELIEFRISGENHEELNILIYNAAGQVITKIRSAGQSTIRHNTSTWAPGIYFYSVRTDKSHPIRGEFIIM